MIEDGTMCGSVLGFVLLRYADVRISTVFFINRITIGSQIGCPRLLGRWSEAYVRLFQFCRVDWRISTNLCVDDNKVFL